MLTRFKRKFKKIKPIARFIFLIITLAYFISFIFFAKNIIVLNDIETFIRFTLLIILFTYLLFYIFVSLDKMFKKKYLLYSILSVISTLLIAVFCLGSVAIDFIYDKLSSFSESEKVTYSSYLIDMKDSTFNAKSVIGMISDENDIEGNVLAKKLIEEKDLNNKIEKYDDYLSMLYALYEGDIDACFVSGNYVTLYSSEADFNHIATETKVVYQISEEMKNEDSSLASNKKLTEPFSVLIMGVDSEYDGLNANAAFNGDTLILATFNPDTFNATLLSIPRDTYVPISCRDGAMSKINSSAAYGTSCVIDTVEDLTGIEVDYYVKINFKGVVDLVEALGGVEVEVEAPDFEYNHGVYCNGMVCEQNSDRAWGDKTIYIPTGLQTLNGEEALAYARCRALYYESDLARNRHQQDIIMAAVKKMIQIRSYSEFKSVIDAISKNIATNMSTSQILSSYNIFKEMVSNILDEKEFINIQKSYLETYTLPVYLPSVNRTTSALGYYEGSLKEITDNMKVNLGLEEYEYVKSFSYLLNETYEEKVFGKGITTEASNTVIESMIGNSKGAAERYCANNGYDCSFKYVDENSSYYDSTIATDLIAGQNPHAGTLAKGVGSITFYINGATTSDLED